MDILSTPWTPTLHGNVCVPYPLYEDFIEEDPIPNCIEHTTWAESTLDPELKKTPSGRAALWEGILALWRLKTYEENGTNEESWRNLVSAWLVRSCWLILMIRLTVQYRSTATGIFAGTSTSRPKRPLQESPPQVRSVLKRHRGEARMNKAELGVDLGRLSVREGSPIDIKLIPALKNQVSFTSHH
jgi:hypothetical protein